MAGLFGKLFRIGKRPDDLRFTGEIPGRKSVGLVRGYGGSLALTNKRVLGTVSVLPGAGGRAVDNHGTPRNRAPPRGPGPNRAWCWR